MHVSLYIVCIICVFQLKNLLTIVLLKTLKLKSAWRPDMRMTSNTRHKPSSTYRYERMTSNTRYKPSSTYRYHKITQAWPERSFTLIYELALGSADVQLLVLQNNVSINHVHEFAFMKPYLSVTHSLEVVVGKDLIHNARHEILQLRIFMNWFYIHILIQKQSTSDVRNVCEKTNLSLGQVGKSENDASWEIIVEVGF